MSSELPGEGYWYWMASRQVFYSRSLLVENVSAVHPLLFLQQGAVVEICFGGGLEGWDSLSALSWFYKVRSERQMTMCVFGGEGKEDVKDPSLSDHPGATVAVSFELRPRPFHSYTTPHSLRPAFPTGLTQLFHSRISDTEILTINLVQWLNNLITAQSGVSTEGPQTKETLGFYTVTVEKAWVSFGVVSSCCVTWLSHRSPCPLLCPCHTELSPEPAVQLLMEVPAWRVLLSRARAGPSILVTVPGFQRRQGRRSDLRKPPRVLLRAGMLTQLQAVMDNL